MQKKRGRLEHVLNVDRNKATATRAMTMHSQVTARSRLQYTVRKIQNFRKPRKNQAHCFTAAQEEGHATCLLHRNEQMVAQMVTPLFVAPQRTLVHEKLQNTQRRREVNQEMLQHSLGTKRKTGKRTPEPSKLRKM
uniref:Uncharacterized protein n=1 Tax=Physcomitrium patens TaxID=3218 RepID=A9TUX0_PHYPA|nr:hypothetical protein PHYPA_021950 [Physcomitrium patens]